MSNKRSASRRSSKLASTAILTAAFLLSLLGPLLAVFFSNNTGNTAYAAASSLTIPSSGKACIPHIMQDSFYNNPMALDSEIQAGQTVPDSTSYNVFTTDGSATNTSSSLKNKINSDPASKQVADFLINAAQNASSENRIYIYFSAADVGTNKGTDGNDAQCLRSLRLFQDPTKGTHFVGWLWDYSNPSSNQATFLDGDYNPGAKTITVHMPGGNVELDLKEDRQNYIDYRDTDIATILSSSTLNPPAGNGNAAPLDVCATAPSAAAKKACEDIIFVDPNTITWRKETYTLAKWAGSGEERSSDNGHFNNDGMRYYLSKANEVDHKTTDNVTNTSKRPYLQLHTDGDDNGGNLLPYNVDGLKGGNDGVVKEFLDALSNVNSTDYWGRQVLFTDFDALGNEQPSAYKVAGSVTGLQEVATYFANDNPKVIGITIGSINGATHAGEDERELIVPYTQDSAEPRKFVAPQYYPDCQTLQPYILLNEDPSAVQKNEGTPNASWNWVKKSDCSYVSAYITVQLEDTKGYNDTIVTPSESSIDDGSGIDLNCDFDAFNPLSWFMCPLIEGATKAINSFDTFINNALTVPVGKDSYFDENGTKGGTQIYQAWTVMRNMSLSLLVIIALIMVLSQAFSFGPFDAYTVKKVLPRIVIASIAVILSWQMTKLLVGISNDLGHGIGAVIETPFRDLPNPKIGTIGQAGTAIAVLAGFFTGVDLFVILSFVITAFAGVMIAFLVIAFRSILVILLAITGPLALVLWILPNTQKGWKFWKENISAVLLSYPIIVGIITMGRVFAILTSNFSSAGLFRDVMTFISYFGPYFALPAAFRLAGGAVASIGGIVNDRGKGFFDRNKKFRAGAKERAVERRRGDNTFRGGTETNFRGRLNRGVAGIYNAKNAGFRPSAMRANLASARATHEHDAATKFMKEDHDFDSFKADDDKLWAGLKGGDSVDSIAAYLQANDSKGRFKDIETARQAAAEVLRAKKKVGAAIFNKAAVRAMAPTGTAFKDAGEMLNAINEVYGSDRSGAGKAVAEMRSASMNAGRADLGGASYGATAGAMQALYDRPSGVSLADAMNQATASVVGSAYSTNGANVISHSSMKGDSVKAFLPEIQARLEAAAAQGQEQYDRELARTANLYDTMAASSPQNAEILREGVTAWHASRLPTGAMGPTREIWADIERSRNSEYFRQLRREYSNPFEDPANRGLPPNPGDPAQQPPTGKP